MRFTNPIFLALCLLISLAAPNLWGSQSTSADVLASDELVIPRGGASTSTADDFDSPAEAAAATDRQPFVYVSGRNIDYTELQRLVHDNDLATIQSLVDADPAVVNVENEVKGWTAIYEAARAGNIDALEIMCAAYGADIDATSKRGGSPVMAAAWFNRPATVRWLVEQGCSTSIENLAGDTLHSIATRRCPGVVEWLEARGITE